VPASAVGEAATRLTGLSPASASLLALARSDSVSSWPQVRGDPGAVLLLFRHAPAVPLQESTAALSALLRNAEVLEHAAQHLDTAVGIDWAQPAARRVGGASLAYAHAAEQLARLSGRVEDSLAWVGGLLAPLGWLAICAVHPPAAAACFSDDSFAASPSETQVRCWGIDQAGIARRLARRWRLPPWLAAITGHLGLAPVTAAMLGADLDLFRVVQLAAGLVEKQRRGLGLTVAADWPENATALGLSLHDQALGTPPQTVLPSAQFDGSALPLLREFLYVAAENRRLADAPVLERLERDVDLLHRALETQRADEAGRLQAMNLGTMAEFAAGAGHEINNPLAVISGQAQYLLAHEPEPSRQRALQTIIGQTQRIHDILTELMQFARPGRPQKRPVELGSLLREVTVSLGGLAEQRRVRLVCPEVDPDLGVFADPRQAQIALTCLLRNAIEAAPADGWAGVRVRPAAECVDLLVEDSGPGPAPQQRPHLFDPFYSGRQAGRGRGLGLPTAWRLARENGGAVFFDDLSDGPTRFVLTLPRAQAVHGPTSHGNGVSANGHADAPVASPSNRLASEPPAQSA
jgi:two-component system NtrC family sensor kinase